MYHWHITALCGICGVCNIPHSLQITQYKLICPRPLRSAASSVFHRIRTTSAAYHFRLPLSTSGSALVHVSKRLWVRVPQMELNFLLSFLSNCYLSSTSFYLSSTLFCAPVFIQLCLAWNRERVALQLRAPPIDE